jgi:hypothetical protein
MNNKPILLLDFDGTATDYKSGWQGPTNTPDKPVEGLFEFLVDAILYFRVNVFSARSAEPGGIEAMKMWFMHHEREWRLATNRPASSYLELCSYHLEWPTTKPGAFITLDDRVWLFTGKFPSVKELLAFRPWWKGGSNTISETAKSIGVSMAELRIAAMLLEQASELYSNHGCNTLDLKNKKYGFSLDIRNALAASVHSTYHDGLGDPRTKEKDDRCEHDYRISDYEMLRYLAKRFMAACGVDSQKPW